MLPAVWNSQVNDALTCCLVRQLTRFYNRDSPHVSPNAEIVEKSLALPLNRKVAVALQALHIYIWCINTTACQSGERDAGVCACVCKCVTAVYLEAAESSSGGNRVKLSPSHWLNRRETHPISCSRSPAVTNAPHTLALARACTLPYAFHYI